MDLSTNKPLKIVFIAHFLLMTWGTGGYWSPDSYFFYNLILLLLLAWTIHSKDDPDPMQLALAVNLISIVLDLIVLSSYSVGSTSGERFSFTMAIMNLLVRAPSSFVMFQNCKTRLGATDPLPNLFGERRSRDPYEDIESRS